VQFSLRDSISLASGSHNEDRFGQHGAAVWVIDGATDLLERPLLPGPSDAAWIADALNLAFTRLATRPELTLAAILSAATTDVRDSFDKAASRPIAHRHEQPSAAGIFARISDGSLEALSLGDCTLLSLPADGTPLDLFRAAAKREADEEARAAARVLSDEGSNQQDAASIRAELMPLLRRGRDRLNTADGYGAFSIDLPPERFVREISRLVSVGDVFLLASDGFLRLVDVYGAYTLPAFGAAIRADGIASMTLKLRQIETEDADCRRFPRVKVMDDATALIVEVTT
jgi:hypothetical protein